MAQALQPAHRGAYEHLWSEHRYAVLAASLKHTKAVAGKLGKSPHVLSFLAFLAEHSSTPRPNINHALLSVYDHLRRHLDRKTKRELVEAIIESDSSVEERLFSLASSLGIKSLYGCRLFYKPHGFNKFWNNENRLALYVLLGTRMIQVTLPNLRMRIESIAQISSRELDEVLYSLQHGISRKEYDSLPQNLRRALEDHVMTAVLPTAAVLNPKIELPLPAAEPEPADSLTLLFSAVERIWDADITRVSTLPSLSEIQTLLNENRLGWLTSAEHGDSLEPAMLSSMQEFENQRQLEHGRKAVIEEKEL